MKKVICFHNPNEENAFLSNWFFSDFEKNGVRYSSMEQYMMHQKALTFGDTEIAEKVMAASDFGEIKALGRQVRGYDDRIWSGIRQIVVYEGLLEKFRQNPDLKAQLFATEDAVLAECAFKDQIWAIGLAMKDENRLNMEKWRGQNLLGFTLMQVRQKLRQEHQCVVVMSGSFNPPTIAHYNSMVAAMDAVSAKKGIFVPTPAKDLRYKMRKAGFPEEVIGENSRIAMLQAMAAEDKRLEVSDVECVHTKWRAMETMQYFREQYPQAELYYLIGSDNLEMFLRSRHLKEFLADFHFAVVQRDGEDIQAILRENPEAWERKNRFAIIPAPAENQGISSTAVREKFRTGEPGAEKMLHPKVMELMESENIWKEPSE